MSAGSNWVERYVAAWNTNLPEDIRDLFTDAAIYEYEPSADPLHGREAIVESWVKHPDEQGSWTFDWSVFVERPGLVIVKGQTHYVGRKLFDNLWVIQLDADGRASRFTEWFMERPQPNES